MRAIKIFNGYLKVSILIKNVKKFVNLVILDESIHKTSTQRYYEFKHVPILGFNAVKILYSTFFHCYLLLLILFSNDNLIPA